MAMTKRKRFNGWFRVLWTLAVVAAVLVVLPLLAMWSLVVLWSVVLDGSIREPIQTALGSVWLVAGVAGLAGLVAARGGRPGGLRPIRVRQGLLLAGIAAAIPPLVGASMAAFDSLTDDRGDIALWLGFAGPFVVLIAQARVDVGRLQQGAASLRRGAAGDLPDVAAFADAAEPAGPVPACFLALAILCVIAALIGQLLLDVSVR